MNTAGMLSVTGTPSSSPYRQQWRSAPTATSQALYTNKFLMSKNLINTETLLLNELVLDLNTEPSFSTERPFDATHGLMASASSLSLSRSAVFAPNLKMQKYKLFAEQTDQASCQINKQINKLADLLDELKKSIQNQVQLIEQINEPLVNLAKYSFSNEISAILDAFTLVGKVLADNLRNFLNAFIELTLNPIQQISRNFETAEKELTKKALEKAFKERDVKPVKQHRKNQKSVDLSNISNSFLSDELAQADKTPENLFLHQKLCEYLSHVYAEKTSSFNLLAKSMMDFYKAQVAYLERSLRTMSSIGDVNEPRIEALLKKFNADQSNETKIICELSARCQYQNSLETKGTQATAVSKHTKSCENLYVDQLRPKSAGSAVIKRSAERSPLFKSGYLLKKPHHQGVRNWLRRKCVAENGYLFIHHAEENESPVKLNLILCNVKVDDNRKFRIFSGSNNRVYDFMAESDEDLKDWVSILNASKVDALEKELTADTRPQTEDTEITQQSDDNRSNFSDNRGTGDGKKRFGGGGHDEKAQEFLVKSMIRDIQAIEGNDHCCDCGAREADWLVTNLGILVCIECCGIHREMGVHISKTQSIKIDRLSPSQLSIARMSGNRLVNRIFEASIVDQAKKLDPKSTMEQRQKFIKIKYEQHLFAEQLNASTFLNKLIETMVANPSSTTARQVFDLVLQLFAQNYDLMSPLDTSVDDPQSRSIIQFLLDNMFDESEYLFLIEFMVQNRDYPKNKFTINFQDRAGNTAVHHAVANNRLDCLKILLKASDIQLNVRNRHGQTPLELALSLGHQECTQILSGSSVNFEFEKRSKPVIVRNMGECVSSLDELGKRHYSKHNRVASDPFNLIKYNCGTMKNFPRLLDDRKIIHRANKTSTYGEKLKSYAINNYETEQVDLSNKYKAIASYTSKNPSHLSFKSGDLVVVLDRSDDQYWSGFLETNPEKRGYFPANLVNLYV